MTKYSTLKLALTIGILFISKTSMGNLLWLSRASELELSNPKLLSNNLSTPLGQKLFEEKDYAKQTEMVRTLSAQAVGDTEEQAGANFDLGAAYFFGMGVKKDNSTATLHFRKSYERSDAYNAGISNSGWIQFGPVQRK
jgi:TPR repeat protein